MDETIDQLVAQDRTHVVSMLTRYGLDADMHMRGHLKVPSDAVLDLRHDSPAGGMHLLLRTDDLSRVKRWIGTPDAVFDDEPFPLAPPNLVVDASKDLTELNDEESQALWDAARHYIYGDSRQVEWYKGVLERHFAPFTISTYVYTTLEVEGELHFTDPSALVLANTIRFSGCEPSSSSLTGRSSSAWPPRCATAWWRHRCSWPSSRVFAARAGSSRRSRNWADWPRPATFSPSSTTSGSGAE